MCSLLLQFGLNRRQTGSSVTSIVPFLKLKENLVLVSVFRDILGCLIQTRSMVFPYVTTAFYSQATTLQQVLQIILDLCLNLVVFESDCQPVVNVIRNNNSYIYINYEVYSLIVGLCFYPVLVILVHVMLNVTFIIILIVY